MLKKITEHLKFRIDNLRHKRKQLVNNDFTLFTNNCVGGIIYHQYNKQFTSPTINLFFYMPDYIQFLKNLDYYLKTPLEYRNKSKYASGTTNYPVGYWPDNVEIQFLHYNSATEVDDIWNRRIQRINMNNLYIIGSERDLCTPEIVKEFDQLPFKHKVFFSASAYNNLESVIHIDKNNTGKEIDDLIKNEKWLNYFDLTHWLNTGKIKRYRLKKILYNYLFSD